MTDTTQAGNTGDPGLAALNAVSESLVRRGYLTTEWWTTIIGGAVSAILALVHINASSATHVVAVAAPAILAALYAVTRTMHKSALASALGDLFPQTAADSANTGTQTTPAAQGAETAPAAQPIATPVAQTSPDFVFQGIPPIEQDNG
jgi:hypothetical protein